MAWYFPSSFEIILMCCLYFSIAVKIYGINELQRYVLEREALLR